MAKRGEVSLRASERLKDFDASRFAAGDRIAFKSEGRWRTEKLVDIPGKDAPVERTAKDILVRVNIGGTPTELSTNLPPKKMEFYVGDSVPGATRYNIIDVRLGPNGEIWYDLEDDSTAPPTEVHNVDQEMLSNTDTILKLNEKIGNEVNRLTDEIKNIASSERTELMERLTAIRTKVEEASLLFGKAETWNKADQDELASLTAKTKQLEEETSQALEELDKDTKGMIEKEASLADPESDAGKKKAADDIDARFNSKIKLADGEKDGEYQRKKKVWDARKKEFDKWNDNVEKVRADLEEANKGKDSPAKQRRVSRLQTRLDELEDLAGAEYREDPGLEPQLELVSASEESKDEKLFELFEELQANQSSLPSTLDAFGMAVTVLRREKAGNEGHGAYFPPGNHADFQLYQELTAMDEVQRNRELQFHGRTLEDIKQGYDEFGLYRQATIEMMKKVMKEWGEKPGVDVQPFNFAKEKKQLQDKLDALRPRAKAVHMEDDLDNEVALLGSLQSSDPQVSQQMIDIWKGIGDLEVEIFAVEKAPTIAPRESKVGFVDLPRQVTVELLRLDPTRIAGAMEEAFECAITKGSMDTKVRQQLVAFVDNITLDQNLRERLAQHGIKDWDTFKEQWKNELVVRFSMVLIEMADSELRNMVTQTLSDIKDGEGLKILNAVSELWNYSAVGNMKGTMALRTLINFGVLLTTGAGTELLLTLLRVPGAVKGGMVGGVVGLAKAGLQRFMGRNDQAYFEKAAKEAQAEGERKKKQFIRERLMSRLLDAGGNLNLLEEQNLASLFSSVLTQVTREQVPGEQKLDVPDPDHPSVKITLEGDAVCAFHEGLQRAAEDQEEDKSLVGDAKAEARAKFAFAKELYALRNNKAVDLKEMPPAAVRATHWLMDTYSGRIAAKPGSKKADILTRGQPSAPGAEGQKIDFLRQSTGTIALGATIGEAMVLESNIVATGLGAAVGVAAGERSAYRAERSQADRESRGFLENLSTGLGARLQTLTQDVAGGETLDQFQNRRVDRAQSVAQLDTVLAHLLQGRSLEGVSMDMLEISLPSLEPGSNARFFTSRNRDLASILQRDEKLRTLVEGIRREISRSGESDVLKFADRLQRLRASTDQLQKNADKKLKNSLGTELWRGLKRHTRGAVYGAIGGALSYGLRYTIRGVKESLIGDKNLMEAVFGTKEETASAGHPADTAKVAAGAAVGAKAGAGAPDAKPIAPTYPEAPASESIAPAHPEAAVTPDQASGSRYAVREVLATTPVGQGGSAEGSEQALLKSAAHYFKHDDGTPWTQAEKSHWMREELGDLQVQSMKGGTVVAREAVSYQYGQGEIKHPLMLHPTAKFELYRGGDGKLHVLVKGEVGKDFNFDEIIERRGAGGKAPIATAEQGLDKPAGSSERVQKFIEDRIDRAREVAGSREEVQELNDSLVEKPKPVAGYSVNRGDTQLMRDIDAALQAMQSQAMAAEAAGGLIEVHPAVANALVAREQFNDIITTGKYDQLADFGRSLSVEGKPMAPASGVEEAISSARASGGGGGGSHWEHTNQPVARTPIKLETSGGGGAAPQAAEATAEGRVGGGTAKLPETASAATSAVPSTEEAAAAVAAVRERGLDLSERGEASIAFDKSLERDITKILWLREAAASQNPKHLSPVDFVQAKKLSTAFDQLNDLNVKKPEAGQLRELEKILAQTEQLRARSVGVSSLPEGKLPEPSAEVHVSSTVPGIEIVNGVPQIDSGIVLERWHQSLPKEIIVLGSKGDFARDIGNDLFTRLTAAAMNPPKIDFAVNSTPEQVLAQFKQQLVAHADLTPVQKLLFADIAANRGLPILDSQSHGFKFGQNGQDYFYYNPDLTFSKPGVLAPGGAEVGGMEGNVLAIDKQGYAFAVNPKIEGGKVVDVELIPQEKLGIAANRG